jgi:hypothetical protein
VGWHIALKHLRSFIANLPTQPEGVPFDPWTAGLPESTVLEPQLVDANHDGRIDSLVYRYTMPGRGEAGGSAQPIALTDFIDFSQSTHSDNQLERVPEGLWGLESRGQFRFDVFLTVRADGTTAAGYTNREGTVDEIRIAHSQQETASIVWRRDQTGQWHVETPTTSMPLIDATRIGSTNLGTLQAIANQILGASSSDRRSRDNGKSHPPEGADRRPNKM